MNPETLEKMIQGGRDSYEARLAAGQARLGNGDIEQAIEHFRRAVEHDDAHSTAWQLLGKALVANDETQAAAGAWRRGIDVARARGDKQAEKVMSVWLRRIDSNA